MTTLLIMWAFINCRMVCPWSPDLEKNKYCSIDIDDHKEIHYILVILQHKIINFEITKLILPRISMYLKS